MQKPRTVFRWNTIVSTVAATAMAAAVALTVTSGASAALPATCVPVYTAGCVVNSPDYTTAMESFKTAQDGSYVGVAKELQWTNPTTSTAGSVSAESQLWRARMGAKVLPSVESTFSRIGLVPLGLGIGWKIGRTVDTKWLHLTSTILGNAAVQYGSCVASSSSCARAALSSWEWVGPGTSTSVWLTGGTTSGAWLLSFDFGSHLTDGTQGSYCSQLSTGPNVHFTRFPISGYTGGFTSWSVGCGKSIADYISANPGFYTNGVSAHVKTVTPSDVRAGVNSGTECYGDSARTSATCAVVWVAPSELAAKVTVDQFRDWQSTDGGGGNPDGTGYSPPTSYNPSATAQGYATTADQDTAFLNALEGNTAGLNAADQALSDEAPNQMDSTGIMPDCFGLTLTACEAAIADAGLDIGQVTITEVEAPIDGAVVTKPAGSIVGQSVTAGATVTLPVTITVTENPDPLPLELPQPEPNETYEDYITRLQDLGYVGTVVNVEETTALDGYGPGSPTRITYTKPGTGTTKVVDPLGWPVPLPRIYPNTNITIRHNPDSAVPVSTDGGSGGGIDFSPLQNISGTCNFPFGVLCWAHDAISAFVAPPEAPEIDWVMPEINTPVADLPMGQHYTVGLSWLDDYMGTIRLMESFVLWFGAVWYVGSRLIGLKGGGDPSDAVDEATNGLLD